MLVRGVVSLLPLCLSVHLTRGLYSLILFYSILFRHLLLQVEWLRERVDNLSQELVLARRDSGRLAKQLKVHIPPAHVMCATPDPYRAKYDVPQYHLPVLRLRP